ncbi:MAG: hypothetical protein JWN56_2054 [Sphingobacteriales bacterium]|nr:hypothetical protein [Sphingobacteriales bacterium]
MESLSLNKLKEEYENKKEILQRAISELIDKENRKDSRMIEKVEAATAEYNLAAKEYQESIKSNFGKAKNI